MKSKKNEKKIITPLYCTHPIAEGEEGTEKNLKDAVEMAKKWVEEHKI